MSKTPQSLPWEGSPWSVWGSWMHVGCAHRAGKMQGIVILEQPHHWNRIPLNLERLIRKIKLSFNSPELFFPVVLPFPNSIFLNERGTGARWQKVLGGFFLIFLSEPDNSIFNSLGFKLRFCCHLAQTPSGLSQPPAGRGCDFLWKTSEKKEPKVQFGICINSSNPTALIFLPFVSVMNINTELLCILKGVLTLKPQSCNSKKMPFCLQDKDFKVLFLNYRINLKIVSDIGGKEASSKMEIQLDYRNIEI